MADTQIFIQGIKYNGKDMDLGHILSSAYIERADIWSPLLILKFNDVNSIIRDEVGLKEGDEVEVRLADPLAGDSFYHIEQFTVLSMPLQGSTLTVNCIQSDIHKLVFPAERSRIFRAQSGLSVIKALLNTGSMRFISDKSAAIENYHLLPTTRPANLIRRIAKETGKMAWYCRGEFTYRSYQEMVSASKPIDYHWNDSRQKNQIAEYQVMNSLWKKKDVADRTYCAFDIREGIVKAGSGPLEWMGAAKKNTLASMGSIPSPALSFSAIGNAALRPGAVIKHAWNKTSADALLDESLPAKSVVYSVTHYSGTNTYQNKVLTMVSE